MASCHLVYDSIAMRIANSIGYDEGRERESSAADSSSGIERCSVAAAVAVSQAEAGQCHSMGDRSRPARSRAWHYRARAW